MMICGIIYIVLIIIFIVQRKKKLPSWCYEKEGKQMFAILVVSNTLALMLWISVYQNNVGISAGSLKRNAYGTGDKTETLGVTIEGELEQETIEIEVQEQKYTKDEIQELFRKSIKELDAIILGKNKSPDYVTYDLNFVSKMPDNPIEVSWETDNYKVINMYGEIQQKELNKNGTLVELRGLLSYENEKAEYVTNVMVYPKARTKKEKLIAAVREEIYNIDKNTAEKEILQLPRKINGKTVTWSAPQDKRVYMVLVLGMICALSMLLLRKQNLEKAMQEKHRQMMLDYPDIINQMILLLGAGMTVKNAWRKMVLDYRENKKDSTIRHAYEEMECTYYEMQSNIPEGECYERFGRRCGLQAYLKLGALLSQNLRKGTRGLMNMLQMEGIHAYEERKNTAKRLGEEAGTKLLIPMFLMLSVVLIIVIVPAFLSMKV